MPVFYLGLVIGFLVMLFLNRGSFIDTIMDLIGRRASKYPGTKFCLSALVSGGTLAAFILLHCEST
ncbi:hypothetical protein BWR18_13130 [Tateyamaria omphalii]|uniref:Uncharacterized protein n=2 Tax=Tateyamaria omphalii TaxID=299262 RepID=A0A1P8MWR0_9RHOB|nr:hypothetical protein BWR18_13130 [Tateyamaria omphalii]